MLRKITIAICSSLVTLLITFVTYYWHKEDVVCDDINEYIGINYMEWSGQKLRNVWVKDSCISNRYFYTFYRNGFPEKYYFDGQLIYEFDSLGVRIK